MRQNVMLTPIFRGQKSAANAPVPQPAQDSVQISAEAQKLMQSKVQTSDEAVIGHMIFQARNAPQPSPSRLRAQVMQYLVSQGMSHQKAALQLENIMAHLSHLE
jgi:hypothetical protein